MKILIVGISVRAMVESAVHSNYSVLALDAFGDQDLRSLAESFSLHHDFNTRYSPDALYKASRQLSYDAVAYTSNLENHPDTLSRIAGGLPIIGNPSPMIRAVRNWAALFARLRQAGFSIPETIFGDEKREVGPDRRWIVKPVLSGGGHGIGFLPEAEWYSEEFMLQEYIPGKACSASFIANGRECVVLGVAGQLIGMHQFGSKGFHYCGNILPLPEVLWQGKGQTILEQVRRLATFLTREYGLAGVNGMDFILRGDQVFLTEVNPRYSASMELIEQAYNLPIFHLHTQAALRGLLPEFKLEATLDSGRFSGKAILFASRNVVAPDTKEWFHRAVRDVPAPGERLLKGNPICTVLATQSTYEGALAELINQATRLKKEIHD